MSPHLPLCLVIITSLVSTITQSSGDDYDGCPNEDWKPYDSSSCYQYFYETTVSWLDAEAACQSSAEGAHLVSVKDENDMRSLFKAINDEDTHWQHEQHFHTRNLWSVSELIWIGLHRWCPNKTGSRWTDNSKVNETFITSVSPNLKVTSGLDYCLAFFMTYPKPMLATQQCNKQSFYICRVPMANVTVTEDTYDEDEVCDGWEWCNYKQFCYKTESAKLSWSEAQLHCQKEGANLFSIHSKDDLKFWTQNFSLTWDPGTQIWTGLSKDDTTADDAKLKWSDNTPLDFAPSMVFPYDQWHRGSCVSLHLQPITAASTERNWKLNSCFIRLPSICMKPSSLLLNDTLIISNSGKTSVTKQTGNCTNGWSRFNNKCYKAFGLDSDKDRASFGVAESKCVAKGGHLVSITDVFENYFVLSLLNTTTQDQSWIGLNAAYNRLKWTDSTPVSYVSLNSASLRGFYASTYDYLSMAPKANYINCFTMSIKTTPGVWEPPTGVASPTNCNVLLSYVCEQFVIAQATKEKSECDTFLSNETQPAFKYGNACYKFISTAKTWEDAESICSSEAHLVSLITISEFGFIAAMAKEYGFQQFWIGLNDKQLQSQYQWTDGWPVRYSQWGLYQPKPTLENRCVKMTQNDVVGGQWSTEYCNSQLPFLCKNTSDVAPKEHSVQGFCEPGWYEGSSQCYLVVNENQPFKDAVYQCLVKHEGDLASFPTKEDLDHLIHTPTYINPKKRHFIGLHRKSNIYAWVGRSKQPLAFVNWGPNQPQLQPLTPSLDPCVEMDKQGLWYTVSCLERRNFICSKSKNTLSIVKPTNKTSTTAPVTKSSNETFATKLPQSTSSAYPAKSTLAPQPISSASRHTTLSSTSRSVINSTVASSLSQTASKSGVSIGIAACVLFFILLFSFVAVILYRKHKAGGGLVSLFRRSDNQMRFEILNENDGM